MRGGGGELRSLDAARRLTTPNTVDGLTRAVPVTGAALGVWWRRAAILTLVVALAAVMGCAGRESPDKGEGDSPESPNDSPESFPGDAAGDSPESFPTGAAPSASTPDSISLHPAITPPIFPSPRAVWIVRTDLADPKRLAAAIDWAADTGFTDLFLQVRGRGDAFYGSTVVPRAESLPPGERDPLAEAIAAARARGLRLHAWINVGIAWSGKTQPSSLLHVARQHRDWFVWIAWDGRAPKNSLELRASDLLAKDIEGYFLDPGNPEVVEHLAAVVRELVASYELDGLHFDYARLPRGVRSFDPVSRTDFNAMNAIDPLTLADAKAAKRRYGEEEADRLSRAWHMWCEDEVTRLIGRLASTAREVRPGITVSAAVYPDPAKARADFGQAWDQWLRDGLIDVAVPMCYAANDRLARADLAAARAGTTGRLWAGLGVYNKPLDRALAGADLARELGYEGVSIFSYSAARAEGAGGTRAIAAALSGFAGP